MLWQLSCTSRLRGCWRSDSQDEYYVVRYATSNNIIEEYEQKDSGKIVIMTTVYEDMETIHSTNIELFEQYWTKM